MIRQFYRVGMRIMKVMEPLLAPFHAGARGRCKMKKTEVSWPTFPVWIHCASAGEWEQIRPVAEALKAWRPDLPILLSFYSPSGFFAPGQKFPADAVVGFPVDTPEDAARFLTLSKPRLALFVKSEIWLHMWEELHRRQIPTVLVAARWGKSRFLEKSWAKPWRQVLEKAAFISTQDEDTTAWCRRHLGTLVSVHCDGDSRVERVKAIAASPWENEPTWPFPEKVAIAGSIWPEDIAALTALIEVDSSVLWVVAPHQMQPSFLAALDKQWAGKTQRWTRLEKGEPWQSPNVIILDVLGQLSKCYRLGKVAYVGGGFGKQVHNVLEPAVYGLPVLFGPRFQRSREADIFVKMGVAFSGKKPRDFIPNYTVWMQDSEYYAETKSLIHKWFKAQSPTSTRVLEQIKLILRF